MARVCARRRVLTLDVRFFAFVIASFDTRLARKDVDRNGAPEYRSARGEIDARLATELMAVTSRDQLIVDCWSEDVAADFPAAIIPVAPPRQTTGHKTSPPVDRGAHRVWFTNRDGQPPFA